MNTYFASCFAAHEAHLRSLEQGIARSLRVGDIPAARSALHTLREEEALRLPLLRLVFLDPPQPQKRRA